MATIASDLICEYKAGRGVNATASGNTLVTQWREEAEAWLCAATKYNWVDVYAGLNADVKKLLDEAVSNHTALYMINYDMSGYASRQEAESMKIMLKARMDEIVLMLSEMDRQDFVKEA